ncbi:MAG TPA: TetR family transcriptional regulator [Mycobacteriales bacterium]|nr:TetR family transcriptional regulator [Mycobacteriales bacterium]
MPDQPRPLRADAARNRARLLEVAYETFAAEGLSVPVDEIARRAGVGAGTLYRHFPTKEALFQAIVADRVQRLVDQASELRESEQPGPALLTFLTAMIRGAATDLGLVEALAGVGVDIAQIAPDAERSFMDALDGLLARAQRAGAVRADIDVLDVKTLLVGWQAMQRYSGDADQTERMLAILGDGLRPSG